MIFVRIYQFLNQKKWLAILLFLLLMGGGIFISSRIKFSEDISQITNAGQSTEFKKILENIKFTDKLFITISLKDTNSINAELLCEFASDLNDSISAMLIPEYISSITEEIPSELITEVYRLYASHMPVFMQNEDYMRLDSIINPAGIQKIMENNYHSLLSPAGAVFRPYISMDPLGIAGAAMKRLQSFQPGGNFEIFNGFIITKDKKNLLIIISTTQPPSETSSNSYMIKVLDDVIQKLENSESYRGVIAAEYYGAAAVAVANATQVKRDIITTVTAAILIILVFVGWFFRSFYIPLVSFIPALFGGTLSLSIIYLIRHEISSIALGIGSVILGIIVDYAIYMYNLYRMKRDPGMVTADLAYSILLCAFSSAAAFFSLLFVQSKVLNDLGLFAGLSVIMAAIFTVIFLPLLLKNTSGKFKQPRLTWVDGISSIPFHKSRLLFYSIFGIALVFFFYSDRVQFEDDLNRLNFLTPQLKYAENHLNKASGNTNKPVYIVSTANSREEALRKYEKIIPLLDEFKQDSIIINYAGIDKISVSDSLQQKRIREWETFWTVERKTTLKRLITENSLHYKFKENAFDHFFEQLDKKHEPIDVEKLNNISRYFLADRLIEKPGFAMTVTLLNIKPEKRLVVMNRFEKMNGIYIIDRQSITNKMILSVKEDFHLMVNLCMLLVSAVIIFAYGRIELGVIASLPMFLSWYITLGISMLLGLKFNVINIIVCTFVFGLGVDYAILMMRGLMHRHKTGIDDLAAYKNAIFISSFTTLVGVGVLAFAKHPALKSVAAVSVIGVLSVMITVYTTIPIMFNWLIMNKYGKRKIPVTFFRMIGSAFSYFFYFLFSALLLLLALLLKLVPVHNIKKRQFIRLCNYYFSRATFNLLFMARKRIENLPDDLEKNPAIIIANHQSIIDIPIALMPGKKLIMLPKERVFNSPFTGWLIKLAGFYPSNLGYDGLIEKFREEVKLGNSLVIFPEGTRSTGESIKRFHKGAFYLAEKLKLDILPMIIYGSSQLVPNGEWVGNRCFVRVKFYPRIKPEDTTFGVTYQEKTIAVQQLFRSEFEKIKSDLSYPAYYKNRLINSYVYKGPVLEWYLRIKLMLENNYSLIEKFASRDGKIVDLGCGYGFTAYMLQFVSSKRQILGIDNDCEKISIASASSLKSNQIDFICANIAEFNFPNADTFILSDVLHYIPQNGQRELIVKCIHHLNTGGNILIRDGDPSDTKKHIRTQITEKLSTGIGFNKAKYSDLFFPDPELIYSVASEYGLLVEKIRNKKHTSNVLYVLKKDR